MGESSEAIEAEMHKQEASEKRKVDMMNSEIKDDAKQAFNDQNAAREKVAANQDDLQSTEAQVAYVGHVSGNELKALAHAAHASNDDMIHSIGAGRGVAL